MLKNIDIEILSLVISIITLLFSIVVYWTHDRKLKTQERLLNEYHLRSFAQSETENKQAVIRAVVKDNDRGGSRILRIINKGKSKAKNLSIAFSDQTQITLIRPELPYVINQLLPGEYREFVMFLCEGDDEATFMFKWEDDFCKENEECQTIAFL